MVNQLGTRLSHLPSLSARVLYSRSFLPDFGDPKDPEGFLKDVLGTRKCPLKCEPFTPGLRSSFSQTDALCMLTVHCASIDRQTDRHTTDRQNRKWQLILWRLCGGVGVKGMPGWPEVSPFSYTLLIFFEPCFLDYRLGGPCDHSRGI